MITMEREGYGHAAPALPEDKARLLDVVDGAARAVDNKDGVKELMGFQTVIQR